MSSEQDLIRQIAAMDDDSLRESIGRVVVGMGIDPSLAALYLGDLGKIRETVMGLTEEDLKQIRNRLGDDTVDGILTNIRKEMGES